ncbi:MAG: radical SAM family heme chaperone HemW [Methylococcaceae bacterium]|nr:radical SAM family heme chaperone HemW [Methylococcaceae bacterium]
MQPLSLYVHIPWCIKKCPYCDFNSHAAKADLPEIAYINALLADLTSDIERFAISRPIHSIFIGGGTPSLFSPESIVRLLDGIKQRVNLESDLEITLEANPGTFESAKFREFNALGINRLSIGIQSFNDGLLTKLGRVHSGKEAIKAVEIAHNAGFANFNLDLMFGLPGAISGDSENDIATAIDLEPTHISFYQLTLEPNTWFHKFPPKLPDDEIIFTTQQNCQRLLTEKGYSQYEISAYSKPGKQCRHNVNYWQFGDYLGIGAGAHGKITTRLPDKIIRTAKAKSPETYLNNPTNNAASQAITIHELPLEYAMNQFRLRTGFTLEHYRNMTGLDAITLQSALSECELQGLISLNNDCYVCTDKGWNFLDNVLEKFIS